jgi:hypothetical protein
VRRLWHPWTTLAMAAVLFGVLAVEPALTAQRGGGAQGGQGGGRGGGGADTEAGPIPRLANGKPDLSGLWQNVYTANMAGRGGNSALDPRTRQPLIFARKGEPLPDAAEAGRTFDLPFTDWGLRQWKAYDPVTNGDYAGNCLPFGMSRSMNSPHGVQIVHHPDAVAFLFEQNTWFHWVPTTPGFVWPEDLPETWTGVSVGRWEDDTLVIETTRVNGYTRLDTVGHPHSRELTLTNTFRRLNAREMEHTVIVHDPRAYTQDWMNVRTWRIKEYPDVIMEYSCEENNLQNLIDGSIKLWTVPEDLD